MKTSLIKESLTCWILFFIGVYSSKSVFYMQHFHLKSHLYITMKESEELIVDDSSGHSNILKVKMNCKSEKIVVARLLQVWW